MTGSTWRQSSPELIARFEAAIPDDVRVERRKMFGYPCVFTGGNMFAGLHQESLVVRLSKADRADALAKNGARIFEPMAGRQMREYVVVPEAILADRSELAAWLMKGLAFAATLPPKQAKKKIAGSKAVPGTAARRKRT